MTGIKILLTTGVAFIAAVVFILFPDITNSIANKLGVGRGADLVFYTSILIFWFAILKLYARIRKLEQIITQVVRKDAIDEAEKN